MIRATRTAAGQCIPVSPNRREMNPVMLFAVEGALLQLFSSVNGFGNNLFATSLGATDQQIGLIQTVPNVAALLFLLPLGILADRLRSSRTIPLVSLLCVAGGFGLMAAVPAMGSVRIPAFFFALVFTVGGPVLYNAQWQTFFGDVVAPDARNNVLTLRNRMVFTMGIVTPLVCGMAMSGRANPQRMYQLFFLICAGAVLMQATVISAIHPPVHQPRREKSSTAELREVVKTLAHSRQFLLFFVPVLLFYITWQMDWSMWYIGQVQYLGLTESQMTVFNGIFNIGQLVAIGVLSRSVIKRGTDATLPFAGIGLCFCPAIMMLCSRIPATYRMPVFTVLVTVLNAPQCATNLCIVQILLRVVPRECRNVAVSLYTLAITLTNCFMPYLGVQMYTAMGSNYRALMQFNMICFVGRILTTLLLVWRCRYAHSRSNAE